MLSGIDVSHYQGVINWVGVPVSFAFIKATEGTGYVDPMFSVNRSGAHAAGVTVGLYHFADNTDPVAEANHFLSTVGTLQPGELMALDWEVSGDGPAFTLAWLNEIKAKTGYVGGVYLNNMQLTTQDWSKVIAGNFWLWYARYNGSQNDAPVWPTCAFKQWSKNGTVTGVPVPVDQDVFYGDNISLRKYGYTPVVVPPGLPGKEHDMVVVTTESHGIWALDGSGYHHIAQPATVTQMIQAGAAQISISDGEHEYWVDSQNQINTGTLTA